MVARVPIPGYPGYLLCERHGYASRPETPCPSCPQDAPRRAGAATPTKPRPARTPPGRKHEDMLAAALERDGWVITGPGVAGDVIRQYAWGVPIGRGFAADFAIPAHALLIEVKGRAHLAGGKRLDADTEREGLAVSLGWRVLPVSHAQVESGAAADLVRDVIQRPA